MAHIHNRFRSSLMSNTNLRYISVRFYFLAVKYSDTSPRFAETQTKSLSISFVIQPSKPKIRYSYIPRRSTPSTLIKPTSTYSIICTWNSSDIQYCFASGSHRIFQWPSQSPPENSMAEEIPLFKGISHTTLGKLHRKL